MSRSIRTTLSATVAAIALAGCGAMTGGLNPGGSTEGLILQEGSLEGWRQAGAGRFIVQPDGSIVSEGGPGILYYAEQPFQDFVLELDFRSTSPGANSGVLLRLPQSPNPDSVGRQGYEIAINGEPEPNAYSRYSVITGAVTGAMSPTRTPTLPTGQWNRYRIEVTGQRYQVWLNGEKVNDFFGDRATQGYIGLENRDPDSRVAFRNIRVTPLRPGTGPQNVAELVADGQQRAPIRVLMVTTTNGFRHVEGIAGAKGLAAMLNQETELRIDTTENLANLNPQNLANYDVLFFSNSTFRIAPKDTTAAARTAVRAGNNPVLANFMTPAQQQAVSDFVNGGKGLVAAHAGLDAGYGWDEYREMVGGGLFNSHPWIQPARIAVEDPTHPAVEHLDDSFWHRDEWYLLDQNPRWLSRVLLSLDASTLGAPNGGAVPRNIDDYPVTWVRNHGRGRVFATTLGHFEDTWYRPEFVRMLVTGIRTAAGRVEAENPARVSGRRVKETIADNVWPDDLAIDDRGNVWIVELTGKVFRWDAQTKQNQLVGEIPTTDPTNIEHGLYGVEIDPEFYSGQPYVYLFYAERESFINTLSRFTFRDGRIDMSSEQVLLRVPTEPACCHQSGDLEWGPNNTLFVSTGDTGQSSTRPTMEISEARVNALVERNQLTGYHWSRIADSERTSQNLQDLRGKILRINRDGTIPKDNPFYGQPGVRWEVYAYGLRNPYRFKYDAETDRLFIGIVGPDEQTTYDWYDLSERGGENFGWPRVTGRLFYNEWTPQQIPGFVPSVHEYTYEFGARSASGGPIYRSTGPNAFPMLQNKAIFYDWSRKWIMYGDIVNGTFESDTARDVRLSNPVRIATKRLANIKTFDVVTGGPSPISMEVGPDGCIYVAEFTGFWGPAPGSKVTRYCWVPEGGAAPGGAVSATAGAPPGAAAR